MFKKLFEKKTGVITIDVMSDLEHNVLSYEICKYICENKEFACIAYDEKFVGDKKILIMRGPERKVDKILDYVRTEMGTMDIVKVGA